LRILAAATALALCGAVGTAAAETPVWRHAISLTGTPKYPAEATRMDYVDPAAPKGGRVRVGALGTFDNFNPFVSGVKGNLAAYLMMMYEPLLSPALDEPTTEYGLLAEAVAFPDDHSSVAFRLRPEARWHDGRPVTPDDVVFSFQTWKRLSPQFNRYYQKVERAEIAGPREVRFFFSEKGDPSLPLYVGQMPVLPKHWWEGMDADGKPRDVAATTLEPPLGSGPYRIGTFMPGRGLSLKRVKDYWGRNVPLRVGTENFDRIDVEYYRDANVSFEAFKADRLDIRRENSLKNWVVGYDEADVAEGKVVKEAFRIERLGIATAFVFNQRREKLKDLRIRRALQLAYSFEDVNRLTFYQLMARPGSYFPHTEFDAKRGGSADERALFAGLGLPEPPGLWDDLEPARTAKATNRQRLFRALALLKEVGYRLKDGRLLDRRGEQFSLEFLLENAASERVAAQFADQLEKLGIATQVRLVDDVQYQNRMRGFDFDIVLHSWVQGHAPGNEQREYWTSASAGTRGTNNIGGLADPLIDAVVEKLVLARTRAEKLAAGRLLDRILRAQAIAVLIGDEDKEYLARWNRFGRPEPMPRYGGAAFPSVWWWDEEKARKLADR
jgi:microcin C transport system substrate-binding protein